MTDDARARRHTKRIRRAMMAATTAQWRVQEAVSEAIDAGESWESVAQMLGASVADVHHLRDAHLQRVERRAALDKLTRMAQEDGLYDDPEANTMPRTR
jgi:hypothetical protein